MCGRIEYVVTNKTELEGRYKARMIEGFTERGVINAHYNVPPSSETPVLISEEAETIRLGHWGFAPAWAKHDAKEVINARSETVLEKPYFRTAIRNNRCLIPVTAFFEWHREGKRSTPFRFYTDEHISSLAGVYAMRKNKEGKDVPFFAILTTSANEVMAPVHDRMPVIVEREDEEKWLSSDLDTSTIESLLKPLRADRLHSYQISSLVNNPRNDIPEVISAVSALALNK